LLITLAEKLVQKKWLNGLVATLTK